MLTWMAALPLAIKVCVYATFIILMVAVAIFGKIRISWGKLQVDLGYNKKQRSCKDCAIIVRARGVKASRNIEKLDRINLKNKMNFAEQQLLILQRTLFIEYTKVMKDKKPDHSDEEKEMSSYHTKLIMAMHLLKDELRRAFKENGFHKLNDTQFDNYIKNESRILFDTYSEYMFTAYPNGMTVRYDDLMSITVGIKDSMNKHFESIIRKSKEIELKTIEDINSIEENYEHETNMFLGLTSNNK